MGDRKYRQSGYQDDAPRERRGKPSGAPRPERDGPRGRGLGAPTEWRFQCARCGREAAPEVALDARCKQCGSDLHACVNCRHFDTSARFECGVEIPARVSPKDRANTCEAFDAKTVQVFASDSGKPDDPKAAFDSLFDF